MLAGPVRTSQARSHAVREQGASACAGVGVHVGGTWKEDTGWLWDTKGPNLQPANQNTHGAVAEISDRFSGQAAVSRCQSQRVAFDFQRLRLVMSPAGGPLPCPARQATFGLFDRPLMISRDLPRLVAAPKLNGIGQAGQTWVQGGS